LLTCRYPLWVALVSGGGSQCDGCGFRASGAFVVGLVEGGGQGAGGVVGAGGPSGGVAQERVLQLPGRIFEPKAHYLVGPRLCFAAQACTAGTSAFEYTRETCQVKGSACSDTRAAVRPPERQG
jgi:hypothetical protein